MPRSRRNPKRGSARRKTGGGALLDWLPVFLALGFFAQVTIAGLQPALRESRRLDSAEARLIERRDQLAREGRELAQKLEAFRDPIFIERERRRLLDPEAQGPGPKLGAMKAPASRGASAAQ